MGIVIVLIGALIGTIGSAVYAWDTIKGRTQPNKVSWLMWSIAPLIGTAAALSKGVTWAILPVFMSGFCPLLIFLISFINPKSFWKLQKSDYICGALSALALLLWAITKDANIAIVFAIMSDFAATLPTLVKCWRHPESESGVAYIGGGINSLTTFAVAQHWVFAEIGFGAYLVIVNLLLVLAVYRKKILKFLSR
jgi:hypothetical protein